MRVRKFRQGFTLVELLVVIAIIGVLVALLLPAVQAAREAARRSSCSNNLKQLSLSLHNYHDTLGAFPYGYTEAGGKHIRNCWFQGVLPFMEQTAMYDQYAATTHQYIMDVSGTIKDTPIKTMNCPSDGSSSNAQGANGGSRGSPVAGYGAQGSYVGCTGDGVMLLTAPNDGLFYYNVSNTFGSVTDGTSNTLAFGEVIIRGKSNTNSAWGDGGSYWGGSRWGGYGFTTMEVPNTTIADQVYSCKSTTWKGAPCTSISSSDAQRNFLRSYHPAGAQVGLVDGSVRFISNTINLTTYRALGTINGGEVVGDY